MNRVAKKSPSRSKGTGSVRIISGQWRGRRLPVPDAEGLRPSTDRTRETLFNWLMNDIQDAVVLDAFAGSGVLGLEALSRYAASVVFIEKSSSTAQQLRNNLKTLKADAEVLCGDSLKLLPSLNTPFNLVFIDPPFGLDLVNPTLQGLQEQALLAENALIYVEQEINAPTLTLAPGWQIIKQKKTGQLSYCLIDAGKN